MLSSIVFIRMSTRPGFVSGGGQLCLRGILEVRDGAPSADAAPPLAVRFCDEARGAELECCSPRGQGASSVICVERAVIEL